MKKVFLLFFMILFNYSFANSTEINPVLINEYDFNKMNAFQVKNSTKEALLPNTPIEIKSITTLTTENLKVGDKVNFVVNKDVLSSSGNIMIKKDSLVYGEVTSISQKGKIGKSAILNIGDIYTTSIDDSIITSHSLVTIKPKNKKITSITLSTLVCPLFLLMKGKEAIFEKDEIKTIYTRDVNYIRPQNQKL